jgi:XTP/dITP diphosphohydrolase
VTAYVLATANPDKAREIAQILDGPFTLLARPAEVPDVEESGATLLDNARLKAHTLAAATGLPAIADDTGLEVDALGGAPGVRSSRYAGERASHSRNVAKLLEELGKVARPRTARFRTIAVVAWPGGRELVAEGVVNGTIATEPRGGGGFGYDPVFVPDEAEGLSFAEMPVEAKNSVSHRGRAFARLGSLLSKEEAGRS